MERITHARLLNVGHEKLLMRGNQLVNGPSSTEKFAELSAIYH